MLREDKTVQVEKRLGLGGSQTDRLRRAVTYCGDGNCGVKLSIARTKRP